jgi:hypothetical protein
MIARIGLPGNAYHTFQRGLTAAQADEWCKARLAERYPDGWYPINARVSVLTERDGDRMRYRDGTRCYPRLEE